MKWQKTTDDLFPTKEEIYFFRKPGDRGWIKWTQYIVPVAMDKELWKEEQWEWLDESIEEQPGEYWKQLAEAAGNNIEAYSEYENSLDEEFNDQIEYRDQCRLKMLTAMNNWKKLKNANP